MAEEYLVKEKKGNMSKIPYLLTPSNEFPGILVRFRTYSHLVTNSQVF